MKHDDLVDLLNTSGPLNLIKASLPERKKWSYSSLRKPLLKAVEELTLRAELDDEEIADIGVDHVPAAGSSPTARPKLTEREEKALKLREDFKGDPRFGAF